MARPRLLALLVGLACIACDGDAEGTDAGPATPDAGPHVMVDAGGPAVGDLESFAMLTENSEGIAFGVDEAGAPTLYVGELGANRLVSVAVDGTVETFVELSRPLGFAARAGGGLVVCARADESPDAPGVLYDVTSAGDVTTLVDRDPSGMPFALTNFVAVAPDDSIVFSDSEADRVYRVDADGSNVALVTDAISYPNGLAFSEDGGTLFVASWDDMRLMALTFDRATGAYGAPAEHLSGVEGIDGVVALIGGAFVLVTSSDGVVRLAPDGSTTTLLSVRQLLLPANGAAGVGPYGTEWVYLSSLGNDEVWRVRVEEPGVALPVR